MTAAMTAAGLATGGGVPLAGLPRRRRWGMLSLGILLVVGCGTLGFVSAVTLGATKPYLAVARPVSYGQVIHDADLTVVDINSASALHLVPASDRSHVVGQRAGVNLVPHTLLSMDELTTDPFPATWQQLVGVDLKPSQLPSQGLRPQATVELVVVASANAYTSQQSITSPPTIHATVAAVQPADASGNTRVDVIVSATDGPSVAAMAAAGRLVVVLTAGD